MQCECYTQKGTRCSRKARGDSLFCGIHKSCVHSVTSSSSEKAVKAGTQKKNKYIKQTLQKGGSLSKQQRTRMNKECGTRCCPVKTDTSSCKYALCRPKTCELDCNSIRSAKIKNNLAHKRSKKPDQAQYEYLKSYLAHLYTQECKKK